LAFLRDLVVRRLPRARLALLERFGDLLAWLIESSACEKSNPKSSLILAFSVGITSVSAYGSYQLKQKGVRWWWAPMVATTVLHFVAGAHNQAIK